MNSINALQKNAFNPLSFVSQRLPSNFHKITALVIAVLALAVVRYAFRSLSINASGVKPFSNTPEGCMKLLRHMRAKDQRFLDALPKLENAIKTIYNAPRNSVENSSPNNALISKGAVNSDNINLLTAAFNFLNPSFNCTYESNGEDFEITVVARSNEDQKEIAAFKKDLDPEIKAAINVLKQNSVLQPMQVPQDVTLASKKCNNFFVALSHLFMEHPDFTYSHYDNNNTIFVVIKKAEPED